MVHNYHSHHDVNSPNYKSHVIKIGNHDFCTGCLGSKFFLVLLLPFLIKLFIIPNEVINPFIDWSIIISLWVSSTLIYSYEILTGKVINRMISRILVGTYVFGSIIYIMISQSRLDTQVAYLLMLIFALPQISIYIYKLITKSEFIQVKSKLFIRVLFIISFFFSLLNFTDILLLHLVVLSVGALIFIRLRSFSNYRVDNDKFIFTTIDINNESRTSKLISKLLKIDENGKIEEINANNNYLVDFYLYLIAGILFIIGIIMVGSSVDPMSSCNTNVAANTSLSVPWLVMSGKNEKYCPNCGAPAALDARFCDSCGTQFPEINKPQQSQQQYQPIGNQPIRNQPYNAQRGYTQGPSYTGPYQTTGSRRLNKGENKKTAAIIGVVIGIFVLLATGNLILAVILGFVAYFGAILVFQTDNPCMAYCIANTCMNCICDATAQGSKRRGKF